MEAESLGADNVKVLLGRALERAVIRIETQVPTQIVDGPHVNDAAVVFLGQIEVRSCLESES